MGNRESFRFAMPCREAGKRKGGRLAEGSCPVGARVYFPLPSITQLENSRLTLLDNTKPIC